MRIAVASGKGGTGKTTIAVGLALALRGGGEAGGLPLPLLVDCDVEAPDAHLFLKPAVERSFPVTVGVPEIDPQRCTLCGRCVDVCQFNALAVLGGAVRLFPEFCHGCGSCGLVCPEAAITERPRPVGRLEVGRGSGVAFAQGILNVGEVRPLPVIRELEVRVHPEPGQVMILDAPPGTSCPMVETVRGADFVLLVTEATPFGLHDLELAVEVLQVLGIPGGVVVNRDGAPYEPLDAFCSSRALPILLRVPFDRSIAEGIARGSTLLDAHPEYAPRLRQLLSDIREMVAAGAARAPAASSPASPPLVRAEPRGSELKP